MKRGFTLIEIMVTVAIVVILISMSVPPILRSRVVANEGACMANLKTLNTACQSYHMDQGSYPASLSVLSSATPPFIDNVLGSGQKQGYNFTYDSADSDHLTVHADSTHTGLLKGRYFYMDESGVIRANETQRAGPNDQIVN